MPPSSVFLSIIFPAHNEEGRIAETLRKTISFLEKQSYPSEILVIENGSQDKTLEIARSFLQDFPALCVIHEDQRGKGLAVKRGMLEAIGEYRFICDVDLSMPVEEVNRFLPPLLTSDITIASREAAGAKRFNEPEYRHVIGRVFNLIVRLFALHGLHDTQCGFKCFSARAAEELFPYQTIKGWTFDVEVLYVARKLGYSIKELGIPWYHDPNSKVKVFRDSFQMLVDLLKIRLNDLRGIYAKKV
jgi:glycosyltransferase involved in cell wall biosynthesis